jgi:hypothetical protein
MKHEHTAIIVVLVGGLLAYYIYKTTGAATNCSFWDTLTGACGAS